MALDEPWLGRNQHGITVRQTPGDLQQAIVDEADFDVARFYTANLR